MQRWLSVEDDDVVILQMPLHHIPRLQIRVHRVLRVAQVDALPVVADNVLGARVLVGPVVDVLLQPVNVEVGHPLRHGQRQRNRCGDAHL